MLRSLKSNKREGRYVAGPDFFTNGEHSAYPEMANPPFVSPTRRESDSPAHIFFPLLSLVSFIHEHVIEVDGPADSLAGVFAALFTVNRVTTSGG